MNTQHLVLDLTKQFATKKSVYIGYGDKSGTILLATITDAGMAVSLADVDVTLKLPNGDIACSVSENKASCAIDESLVPDGTEHAYYVLDDGGYVYSTQRFRIVTLAGYREE